MTKAETCEDAPRELHPTILVVVKEDAKGPKNSGTHVAMEYDSFARPRLMEDGTTQPHRREAFFASPLVMYGQSASVVRSRQSIVIVGSRHSSRQSSRHSGVPFSRASIATRLQRRACRLTTETVDYRLSTADCRLDPRPRSRHERCYSYR